MKEGYIVMNISINGVQQEIFGVYRTLEKAERILKKIKKCRYGDMTEDEINEWELENGDEICIVSFEDTNGHTHSIDDNE